MTKISIVIPAYERIEPLRETLKSAEAASSGLSAEIIVVDDGSDPPLLSQFSNVGDRVRFVTQANQGSIVARSRGLAEASGEFIQFLDSDDLIDQRKLEEQVTQLRSTMADVSYCNVAAPSGELLFEYPETNSCEELFLKILPAPHSPLYRASFVKQVLSAPLFPSDRRYDPAGDIYLLYNLSLSNAKVVFLPEPYAIVGDHGECRYTQNWERLGIASLGLMRAFIQNCPVNEDTDYARKLVAESAFLSWRKLPRGTPKPFEEALTKIFKSYGSIDEANVGGPVFNALSKVFGVYVAAQLMKVRRPSYESIRTISDEQFLEALNAL